MALISKPNTFSAGKTVEAAEHNSNMDTAYDLVNGNLNTANWSSGSSTKAQALTSASGTNAPSWEGMTTHGDIEYHNGTNRTRLGTNSSGMCLNAAGVGADLFWTGLTTQGDMEFMGATNRERLAAGTNGSFLMTQGAGANPKWNPPLLHFTSSQQTITSGGALTIPHGMGVTPKIIVLWIVCNNAQYSYTAGDWVICPNSTSEEGTNAYGVSVKADATNLTCRYGSTATVFFGVEFSNGNSVGLANANWKFAIEAWV